MERLEFDCVYDLADKITDMLGGIRGDCPVIAVYGKYEVIKELLEDLIMSGVSIANEIVLEDYEVSYYGKEYVLYLRENGVNVEKAYDVDNERYLYGGGDVSFVHEDCNSKLLLYIEEGLAYEFGIGKDESDDLSSDYENSYTVNGKSVSKDEFDKYVRQLKDEDKPVTTSTSTYKVNGEKVSKEEYEKALNELDEKYLDNVQDMLLSYFDFVSEMNQWKRLLGW